MRSLSSVDGLLSWTHEVLFKKSLPMSVSYRLFPRFLFTSFSILVFTLGLWSVWNWFLFKVIFIQVWFYSSACGYTILPGIFIEGAIFTPMYLFGIFVKYQLAAVVCTYLYIFCFSHRSNVCFTIPYSFYYYGPVIYF